MGSVPELHANPQKLNNLLENSNESFAFFECTLFVLHFPAYYGYMALLRKYQFNKIIFNYIFKYGPQFQ